MADSLRLGRKRKAGDSSFYDFEDELAQRSSTARNDPGASKHTQYPHPQGPPGQYRPRSASASRQSTEQRGLFRPRSLSPAIISSMQRSLSGSLSANNVHKMSGTTTSAHNPQRQRGPAAQKSSESRPCGSPELGETPIPLNTPLRYPTASENLKIRKAMRGDKAQQQPRSGSTQAPVKHDTPSLFRKDKTENNVPRIIQESSLRKTPDHASSSECLLAISSASSSASLSPAPIPQPRRHSPRVQIPVNPAKRGTMASTARKPAITYSKCKQPQRKQPGANTHAPARRAAPTSSASQTMEPPSADARRRSHGSGSTDAGVGSSEPAMARSGSSPSRSLRDAPFVSGVFLDERLLERAHHVTVTTTATSTSVSYDLLPVGRSER